MRTDDGSAAYVAVGVGLIAFGVISIFSIGYPLISFGIAHLALYKVRHRRSIRLPIMWGLAAFWVGFIAAGPFWCLRADSGTGIVGCRTLLGNRYLQGHPSYLPGLIVGIIAAATTFAAIRGRVRNRDVAEP